MIKYTHSIPAQGNGFLTDVSGSRIPNIGDAELLVPPFGIYEVEGFIYEIDRVFLSDSLGMIIAGSKQIRYLGCRTSNGDYR
jgi:hypothetical protein